MKYIINRLVERNSMTYSTQKQIKHIIEDHLFRYQQQFNNDPICLKYLLNYITEITVTQTSLLLILKLIKFYKFPILIFIEPFYNKIHEGYIEYYFQELYNIDNLVNEILKEYKFEQLSFFKKEVTSEWIPKPCRKKIKNITQNESNFIHYAYGISQVLSKIRKLLQTTEGQSKQSNNSQEKFIIIKEQCNQYKQQMLKAINQHNFQYEGKMILENLNIRLIQRKFYEYLQKIEHFLYKNSFLIQIIQKQGSSIQHHSKDKLKQNQYNDSDDNDSHLNLSFFSNFEDKFQKYQKYPQKNEHPSDYKHNQFPNSSKHLNISQLPPRSLYKYPPPHLTMQLNNQNKHSPELHPYSEPSLKQPKKFWLIEHLCCRKSFILTQPLLQTNPQLFSFYQAVDLENKQLSKNIKSDICSMLNHKGGFIFLGVRYHTINKQPLVEGIELTQQQKEYFAKSFQTLTTQLKPQITLSNKCYQINFVPVQNILKSTYKSYKNEQNQANFILGRYLIKIKIKWGKRDQIYSFFQDNKEFFCFRNKLGRYYIEGRDLLKTTKNRFDEPLPIPITVHEGPCQKPSKGRPIHNKSMTANASQKISEQSEKLSKISITNTELTINGYFSNSNKGYKKMVFNRAYDFLIVGLSQSQLESIFEENNPKAKMQIRPLINNIIYLRNLDIGFLQTTKQILKDIYYYVDLKSQSHCQINIIPLSRYITIERKTAERCFKILSNYGCKNFECFQNYEYVLLQFEKSLHAALPYVALTDNGISCEFIIAKNY